MKDNKEFSIKTLIARWRAESPKIFKWISNMCVTIGATGTAIMASEYFANLPVYATTIAPHFVVVGVIGGAISKLTVKNPEKLQ